MTDELVGTKLPSLNLPTSDGTTLSLPGDLKGKWALIYFYPEDDTPGCTVEACSFRDQKSQFDQHGIRIFGVSLNSIASHQAFVKKYELNFPLLVDQDHRLSEALHSYKEPNHVSRDSFLVDPDGTIKAVWRKVSPQTTVMEILQKALELK